ncbi:MAG: hypothetical protein ABSH03_09485 [Candidatus Lustribacter sp.]|jgi:hypothetical protein
MAVSTYTFDRPSARAIYRAQDVASPAATAFRRICEVEKWPVWLSFLRSARLTEPQIPFGAGSEVAIRSGLPGGEEELFEVDRFIDGHHISLVGAYSCRWRLDFRVEQKSERSKVAVRLDYPTYGGAVAALFDQLTRRRRLDAALGDSLLHFKGLVEFEREDGLLDDF